MRWLRFFLISTLVVEFGVFEILQAATEEISPDAVKSSPSDVETERKNSTETEEKSKTSNSEIRQKLESVNFSLVPEGAISPNRLSARQTKNFFYQYQSSMAPKVGFGIKNFDTQSYLYYFGFSYMVDSLTSQHKEFGAVMLSDGTGLLQADYRWIFSATDPMRPFAKAGAQMYIDPNQGLNNALQLSSYMVHAAFGVEDLISDPMSARVEFEMGIGLKGSFYGLSVGYSWAW